MKTDSEPPILVTGAHRSGTTWVGKMLAASRAAAYISEPLNVWHRPGVMRKPVQHWYTYINNHNEDQFLPAFKQTIRFDYHLWSEIKSLRSVKDFIRMIRDGSSFLAGNIFGKRALLKDPFAIFSAPWFSERLGCSVVITVRHPAAVANSLKRLDWEFDFGDLLAQHSLMHDLLAPHRHAIEEACRNSLDVIEKSALLWRIIYQIVAQYRDKYPQFIIVRHEDISADPPTGFKSLYDRLGLTYSKTAHKTILKASSSNNPSELSNRKVHSVQVYSQAARENWKQRLSSAEISLLQQMTGEVASQFYTSSEWE